MQTMENYQVAQIYQLTFITYITFLNVALGLSIHDKPNLKQSLVVSGPFPDPSETNIGKGFGCGTIPMQPNRIIQIQSTNFGVGNYFNNEGCTWSFTSTECTLSMFCPCFDIPTSFGCFEDYLKITHQQLFSNRFCGKNYPVGVLRATTNTLNVQFKSDSSGTGKGFLCYVRCTAPGKADPVVPEIEKCPPGGGNPYGFPS